MTLMLKLDLNKIKMYLHLHTKNEVSMSSGSKVIAWTDRNTDRQTDTHTHRQTDRHDRKHYLPTYAGGNYSKRQVLLIHFFCSMSILNFLVHWGFVNNKILGIQKLPTFLSDVLPRVTWVSTNSGGDKRSMLWNIFEFFLLRYQTRNILQCSVKI